MKIKYKRLVAYFIDTVIVSLFVSLIISSNFMSPIMDKYNDASKRLEQEYMTILEDENIEDADIESLKSIIYDINSFGNIYFIIEVICMLGYFVIFQFFNKGQTIGKKMMKIRIVDINNKELSLTNMLLREIILFGIAFTLISMICVEILNPNAFYNAYLIINIINAIIAYTMYFMILFRKDEKGLHDIISSTEVIEA